MFIVRWVYRPPSVARRVAAVVAGLAAVIVALVVTGMVAGGSSLSLENMPGLMLHAGAPKAAISAGVLALLGLGLTYLGNSRYPGRFGLRRFEGLGFLAALPISILVALVGGTWVLSSWTEPPSIRGAVVVLTGIVGIEALMRGFFHGHLLRFFPVMTANGRLFVSIPNGLAALVYAGAVTICLDPPAWLAGIFGAWGAVWFASALVFGLLCGVVRERWRSVWAAVILHAASAITAWLVLSYWL
jgi:membrane protease YdiL (CAAX protease family)